MYSFLALLSSFVVGYAIRFMLDSLLGTGLSGLLNQAVRNIFEVPHEAIEALSLSDYNHLREILGLSPVSMTGNEFLGHCDTWNYMDGIRQGLEQQPEITLNGRTLAPAETSIWTEPMEQYQMAGTKGYVLVLPDEAASRLSGEKTRLAMKLANVFLRLISEHYFYHSFLFGAGL